jgi:hypothetical protein
MFIKGDYVKFETDPKGIKSRWLNNRDFGKSGKWAEGIITEVTEYYYMVDCILPNKNVISVNFPNNQSTFYNSKQWEREGFLQECLVDFLSEKKEIQLVTKCECGGTATNLTHSTWCPKFERLF